MAICRAAVSNADNASPAAWPKRLGSAGAALVAEARDAFQRREVAAAGAAPDVAVVHAPALPRLDRLEPPIQSSASTSVVGLKMLVCSEKSVEGGTDMMREGRRATPTTV